MRRLVSVLWIGLFLWASQAEVLSNPVQAAPFRPGSPPRGSSIKRQSSASSFKRRPKSQKKLKPVSRRSASPQVEGQRGLELEREQQIEREVVNRLTPKNSALAPLRPSLGSTSRRSLSNAGAPQPARQPQVQPNRHHESVNVGGNVHHRTYEQGRLVHERVVHPQRPQQPVRDNHYSYHPPQAGQGAAVQAKQSVKYLDKQGMARAQPKVYQTHYNEAGRPQKVRLNQHGQVDKTYERHDLADGGHKIIVKSLAHPGAPPAQGVHTSTRVYDKDGRQTAYYKMDKNSPGAVKHGWVEHDHPESGQRVVSHVKGKDNAYGVDTVSHTVVRPQSGHGQGDGVPAQGAGVLEGPTIQAGGAPMVQPAGGGGRNLPMDDAGPKSPPPAGPDMSMMMMMGMGGHGGAAPPPEAAPVEMQQVAPRAAALGEVPLEASNKSTGGSGGASTSVQEGEEQGHGRGRAH